jgi:hypothetical protein
MRRLAVVLLAGVSTLALSACATMNVGSYVERGIDFAPYQTYEWGPADALPTGDPRLDNNPFFQDHVRGAVEKQLARRGFTLTEAGTGDLLIHYHANISQRIEVNGFENGYNCISAEDCRPNVSEYEAGTLVLDVADARTKKVVWRGWARDSVEAALNNQDIMEEQFNEAVRRMMTEFPRPLLSARGPAGDRRRAPFWRVGR